MDALTNFGAFVVVLGVMIFFHEFGHFATAKAFGMRVFVFSFGFGKRLLGFKWGDTDYRISLVPLGGYVKLEGEPEDFASEDVSTMGDGKDFTSRPRWQRLVVYVAGPVANVVLTVTVLTLLYMIGFQVDAARYDRPLVGAVTKGSPADKAGIVPGDEIMALDGAAVANWEGLEYAVLIRPERQIDLRVKNAGGERTVQLTSESKGAEKVGNIGVFPLVRVGQVVKGAPAEQAGLQVDDAILRIGDKAIQNFSDIPPLVSAAGGEALRFSVWRAGQVVEIAVTPRDDGSGVRIGIAPKLTIHQFGFVAAVGEAANATWNMTQQTFEVIGRLVTARISPKTMMGPLGIAKASGDAARSGAHSVLYLIAVISLQIGIFNLFPLPPLDGGHMAILIGESIWRRDFSMDVKMWILQAGAAALLLLVAVVLYSDLSKTSLLGRYLTW